ncbi:hypothetical protein [Mesobacillus foraminis]|uniref:Uncharacterized protein n=2 Tax=Mesobacillus foraminis TaxID=279826 RepID=A0A4R2BIP8_9BACI|nr:hypothetical protein [Mesobacillus foraminis]TCN26485.1 hypothetical protein EV146_1036 [Mesobacillus foraminis]
MNAGVNMGDIIFQVFSLGVPIFFIAILLLFWRSSKKKKEQLNVMKKGWTRYRKK